MVMIRNSLPQPIAGSSTSTGEVFYTKDMILSENLTYQAIEIPRPDRWRIPKGCLYFTQIHNGETFVYTVLQNENEKRYYFISISESFTVSFQNNIHQNSHQFAILGDRIFLFVNPNTSIHTLYEWDKDHNQWIERYNQFRDASYYHCFGFMDTVLCIISESKYMNTSYENVYYESYFFGPDMNPVKRALDQTIPDIAIRVSHRVFMMVATQSTDKMSVYVLEGEDKNTLKIKLVPYYFYTKYNVVNETQTTTRQNQIMCFGYRYSDNYDYLIVNNGYGGYKYIEGKQKAFSDYRNSLFSIYLNPKEILYYSKSEDSYNIYKMDPSGENVQKTVIRSTKVQDHAVYPLPGLPVICYDPDPNNANGNLTLYMGVLETFPVLETPGTSINSKMVTDTGEILYPKNGERLTIQPSRKDFKGRVFIQKGDKGYSF